MKVILMQDVKGTGKKGEVKEVAEGYGRNYLLPRKLAVEASGGNINSLKEQQRVEKERQQQQLAEAEQLAEKINAITLEIHAKAGKDGRLFGAVTSKQISKAFQDSYDLKIDKKKIGLKEPIKHPSFVKVPVKLHPKVTATVTVQVVVTES